MSIKTICRLTALAAFFSASVLMSGCENHAPAQEPMEAQTPEVGYVVIKSETVTLSTELPGRVASLRVAEIRPQVSGLLQKRFFTEGADVEKGQILYQIDPDPFQAELDQAEANLAVARKTLGRTRAALQASLANVKQQEATLNFAQINRRRFEELIEDGAVSLTERDQAVTEDEVAEAALNSAEAQVARDREAIAEAEAAIKQAEAMVKSASINLGYTSITAPISGRIGRSNITEGAIVTAYQAAPLSTIQQLDPVYVDAPQSTTKLLHLRQRLEEGNLNRGGDDHKKVKILLEDGTVYPLEGDLQFREVTVDQTTGSVVLRIMVPNPDNILLPGMFIQGQVMEGIKERAILAPQQAVTRDRKGNPLVYIVDSDNKAQQRLLTIERDLGNSWLISSGLQEGDRVIMEGMQRIRPGMTVKAVLLDDAPQSEAENSKLK